ncbi:hypothetical protein [Chitinophaga barathri]|uniref:Uncharacterized protein n=1 Tax=Chitinophaga barathri TaxID=1647451 RepID=A0A3N4M7D9_9BACT|nr:hypothetical protein [Chitinophaga barathri]RPD39394.1 hypothetical protein EG028_19925 [Chitinophaga barathri]
MKGFTKSGDTGRKRGAASYMLLLMFAVPCMFSCYKYKELEEEKEPAYLRVFNSIAFSADATSPRRALPFFTFMMDPETDADGVPTQAKTMCDFLTTRQLYSSSYPMNEANSSEGTYVIDESGTKIFSNSPLNFEYPGNAHVLTAPAINGFDMSAWAQIPSGRHRIMFISRPKNDVPFTSLSKEIRKQVVIDTVVEFQKGEVYTMQILSEDPDNNTVRLYVRREQFIHQAFEEDKLYVGYLNLSGKRPRLAADHFISVFPEKVRISYSYKTHDDVKRGTYHPLPGFNNVFYTILNTRQDTTVNYMTLPLLPRDYFFEKDTLRSYYRVDATYGVIRAIPTLPYAEFYFADGDGSGSGGGAEGSMYMVAHQANPVPFNIYRFKAYRSTSAGSGEQAPSLNLIVSSGGSYHVYATVNIMEIVYDRIYMMQIQRAFNKVPG